MPDAPRTPAAHTAPHAAAHAALSLAQAFIHAVEAKDLDGVARTLAADAQQLFIHSRRTKTADGAADIIAGRAKGAFCVADVQGKDEILAYTNGLIAKFAPLIWRDTDWSVSPTGDQVVFRGTGDMVVARSKRPYRNSYVTRFGIEDGEIVRITEYADAFMYARLRVRPNGPELRALWRAAKRLLPLSRSTRSGRWPR